MTQMTTQNDGAVRDFVSEWTAALLNGNVEKLNQITAEHALSIGPLGFVLNKDQWLGGFKSGDLKYVSLTWDEVSVIDYGDTAIVVGRDKQTVKYKDDVNSQDLRGQLVLVKQDGNWKLASQQYSPIRAPGGMTGQS
jgi:ketosteroid isomerase-like protein